MHRHTTFLQFKYDRPVGQEEEVSQSSPMNANEYVTIVSNFQLLLKLHSSVVHNLKIRMVFIQRQLSQYEYDHSTSKVFEIFLKILLNKNP